MSANVATSTCLGTGFVVGVVEADVAAVDAVVELELPDEPQAARVSIAPNRRAGTRRPNRGTVSRLFDCSPPI